MAQDLLDRFFRDGEGKTNRQIDVYFALEDIGVQRDKAEEGLEYLSSRGLINMFGPDVAFLTELGIQAISEDRDISKMPKLQREFVQQRPGQTTPPKATTVPPPAQVAPQPKLPDRPQLRYTDMEGNAHVVELGWTCTIGRIEGNTIHLDDQRASKKHAEVRFENGRFTVNDLGAANGTMVNGSYIDAQPLSHGDEILIGRTTLTFEAPRVIVPPQREQPKDDDQETPLLAPAVQREIIRETERPSPSEGIRVVKGRPEPARSQPVPMASASSGGDLFDDAPLKPRVPPFPGPGSRPQPAADPDDLFAEPIPSGQLRDEQEEQRELRSDSLDLFGETAKRPKLDGDLFADTNDVDHHEHHEDQQRHEPSAQDLFSEAAIPRPMPEAPSNLFDEEPNTVFARTDHRITSEEVPLAPAEHIEELDNISMLEPIIEPLSDPMLEPVPLESTLVNTSLQELAERSGVEVPQIWQGHDEHTPADQILRHSAEHRDDDPATEQHSRADLLANAKVELPQDADTEGATPRSARPGLPMKHPVSRAPSEDLPRWGEDLGAQPIGSHPSFAHGSHEHISRIEDEAPGEDLPDASEELADLSMSAIPSPVSPESHFHRTLRTLRFHVERTSLPDRDHVLSALDLLERHPYIRVALNLSEPDLGR
jgi:pSer/pThr/pTyr-binding forkhead associated (FHA) protein